MQMLNKIFLSIFLFPFSIYTCSELDNLNLYDQDTKIISLEYTQIFEESDKSNITGEIYFIKPNLFKITTLLPSKSDLIVNEKNLFTQIASSLENVQQYYRGDKRSWRFQPVKRIIQVLRELAKCDSIENQREICDRAAKETIRLEFA